MVPCFGIGSDRFVFLVELFLFPGLVEIPVAGLFFISYFSIWEVCLFFVIYLGITSLLKLSKSWFTVNDITKVVATGDRLAQMELSALKEQISPHFF